MSSHTAFHLHCMVSRAEGLPQVLAKAIKAKPGRPGPPTSSLDPNPLPPLPPPRHAFFLYCVCGTIAGKSSPVSWMRMLLIMREYCHRYSQQPDEDQEQPQQARQDCLVPPEDVAGLAAFLRLFSQVRSS